jgi:hypothetical protein
MSTETLSDNRICLQEQTQTMSRADVMKFHIGPLLREFLQPVYDQTIEREELETIQPFTGISELPYLCASAMMVAQKRIDKREVELNSLKSMLDPVLSDRPSLTFQNNTQGILDEGIRSGIYVPAALAGHILLEEVTVSDIRFSPRTLAKIMERPSFDEMLHVLTRGPNGFLGSHSVDMYHGQISNGEFFGFSDVETGGRLKAKTVFAKQGDEVVAFSGDYHLAADIKRKAISADQSLRTKSNWVGPDHAQADSSGCPVRHRTEAERFVDSPSLITRANKFLIEILKASQRNE